MIVEKTVRWHTIMLGTVPLQGGGIGGIIGILVFLAILIIPIAGMWKMFEKAGQPGWAAIIPIYNTWVLVKVAAKEWYWFVLLLVPLINFVAWILVSIDISKNFGQGALFGLGVAFLAPIFYPLIGFGGYRYRAGGGANMRR